MKAEMSEDGVITIRPESSVEAYALRKWMEFQRIDDSDGPVKLCAIDDSKLAINATWPQQDHQKYESPRGVFTFLDEKS